MNTSEHVAIVALTRAAERVGLAIVAISGDDITVESVLPTDLFAAEQAVEVFSDEINRDAPNFRVTLRSVDKA